MLSRAAALRNAARRHAPAAPQRAALGEGIRNVYITLRGEEWRAEAYRPDDERTLQLD
jgi:hypothetical protein